MIYDETTQPKIATYGITAMGIVSAAIGVCTYLAATYSADGAIWPLVLVLSLLFNLVYSVVFAGIVGLVGPICLSHAVVLMKSRAEARWHSAFDDSPSHAPETLAVQEGAADQAHDTAEHRIEETRFD